MNSDQQVALLRELLARPPKAGLISALKRRLSPCDCVCRKVVLFSQSLRALSADEIKCLAELVFDNEVVLNRNAEQLLNELEAECKSYELIHLPHSDENEPDPASLRKTIPPPSAEQQSVVDAVKRGASIIVNSVAGSGKTTTACHIAAAMRPHNVLLLTYNSRLKLETRERVRSLFLNDSFEVHSFHSLGFNYYSKDCRTDDGLFKIIQHNLPPRRALRQYKVVIIDEAQDLTLLLFAFVYKFLRDHVDAVQLVVVGDEFQAVYAFKGSDARFLIKADQCFKDCLQVVGRTQFARYSLRTSYRITRQMAAFVSRSMMRRAVGDDYLTAQKDGVSIKYHVGRPWDSARCLARRVIEDIRKGAYTPEDVFVLQNTVARAASNSPLKVFENMLVEAGIPCSVVSGDEKSVSDDLVKGKVAFVSFCQSKGLERKVVMLFGFNAGFFRFFDKHADKMRCPPVFYVAATRAQYELNIIAETIEGDHFPFMDRPLLDHWMSHGEAGGPSPVRVCMNAGFDSSKVQAPLPVAMKIYVVTELTRFLPDYITDQARSLMNPVQLKLPSLSIKLAAEVTQDGLTESVVELNGLAIPAMWEALGYVGQTDLVSQVHIPSSANSQPASPPAAAAGAASGAASGAAAGAGSEPAKEPEQPADDAFLNMRSPKKRRVDSMQGSAPLIYDEDSDSEPEDEAEDLEALMMMQEAGAQNPHLSTVSVALAASSPQKPRDARSNPASPTSALNVSVRSGGVASSSSHSQTRTLCSMHHTVQLAARGQFSDDGSGLPEDLLKQLKIIESEIEQSSDQPIPGPATFLRLSTLYNAVMTGFKHKTSQLKSFNWLSSDAADQCLSSLSSCIPDPLKAKFEVELQCDFVLNAAKTLRIQGIVDAYDSVNHIVYEFKCTSELSPAHFMQLYMYAWLWNRDRRGAHLSGTRTVLPRFRLFNVLTSEMWEFQPEAANLEVIARSIFENMDRANVTLSDDDFLKFVKQSTALNANLKQIQQQFDIERKKK